MNLAVSLDTMRHSCAHLLAAAVHSLWPEAKFGVGPVIADGFYYDIEFPTAIGEGDLKQLELKMKEIKYTNLHFERLEWPINEAIEWMREHGQTYKVELLELLRDKGSTSIEADISDDLGLHENIESVSIYKLGNFLDLCKGPHVERTKQIGEFKLISLAGAYWRGDITRPQLQRIYGLCFENKENLKNRLWQIEEAKKRDHRRLGQQLAIFSFSDEVGQGLPLWLPNGAIIRQELELLARHEEHKDGYVPISTPVLAKETLYQKSGHLEHYQDDMYAPIDIEGEKFYLRPMNCPHHHQVYLAHPHSYRELPLRFSEYGHVYRYEPSGALTGLLRARGFCQNDAHIYCRRDQAKDEFLKIMLLHARYYKLFGIEKFHMRLSLPDFTGKNKNKYVSDTQEWDQAIAIIRAAMEESQLPFKEVMGEAAFYGPKIDFMIESAIGQEYAISTNQLDFLASKRFDLNYIGEDGAHHALYVIHRAPLGSHERFVAFLLEHYFGNFPTWLAPTQVRIIPIADRHADYVKTLLAKLVAVRAPTSNGGLRVDMDLGDERMQKKILRAQQSKIPYMIIVGDAEMEQGMISVRLRDGTQVNNISLDGFIKKILQEIDERALTLNACSDDSLGM